MDVGLGLRPALTGQGLGEPFLQTILAYGNQACHPNGYQLTVASFSQRTIKVYQEVYFQAQQSFRTQKGTEFLNMTAAF